MIKVYEDRGGWRIDVILEGKVQRTAWVLDRRMATNVANEFAEYYGPSRYEPLPITELY